MDKQYTLAVCLLTCFYIRLGLAFDISTLKRCTNPSMENPGYSSTISHGRNLWTHCGFPNPKLEQMRCGRPFLRDGTYDLCDPDVIISPELSNELDQLLWSTERLTPYHCTPWHGDVLNFTFLLVAVRYLRIPDLTSNETCVNGCGEVVPYMDEFVRTATDEEKQLAIETFATGLRNNFAGYFCDNFLVIAYWENETSIATALTDSAASRISVSQVDSITRKAMSYLASGQTLVALSLMIKEYRALILGFTPAMIMLVIHAVMVALAVLFIILYVLFGGKSDYYDEEKWKLVVKTAMKIIFGVWFIEGLLTTLVRVQERIKPWIVIFPLVGLAGALVGATIIYEQESG